MHLYAFALCVSGDKNMIIYFAVFSRYYKGHRLGIQMEIANNLMVAGKKRILNDHS